jgi:hypothetical protein
VQSDVCLVSIFQKTPSGSFECLVNTGRYLLSNITLELPQGVFSFCLARSQACCNGKGCKQLRSETAAMPHVFAAKWANFMELSCISGERGSLGNNRPEQAKVPYI